LLSLLSTTQYYLLHLFNWCYLYYLYSLFSLLSQASLLSIHSFLYFIYFLYFLYFLYFYIFLFSIFSIFPYFYIFYIFVYYLFTFTLIFSDIFHFESCESIWAISHGISYDVLRKWLLINIFISYAPTLAGEIDPTFFVTIFPKL
jgi:hypothetical protein